MGPRDVLPPVDGTPGAPLLPSSAAWPTSPSPHATIDVSQVDLRTNTQSTQPTINTSVANWQRLEQSVTRQRKAMNNMRRKVGAVPGIDVHRVDTAFLHNDLHAPVNITVYDYSAAKCVQHPALSNASLAGFLRQPRPEGTYVRWITTDAVSWDVLRELALAYNLHPLAVEDVVHLPQRIKADFYDASIFISLCMLKVEPCGAGAKSVENAANLGRLNSSTGVVDPLSTPLFEPSQPGLSFVQRRLLVYRRQASIFLLANGIVISFFQGHEQHITGPIREQLEQKGTLARDSEDASFLANLLIDNIVDTSWPVVDAYGAVLHHFEAGVLGQKPDAGLTRELYMLAGDLLAVKRAIAPSHGLVQSLIHREEELRPVTPGGVPFAQRVSFSRLARTYLRDVLDHTGTLSEHVDDLQRMSRDLIDLTFNLTAHHTSGATQILSCVSVLFLPITFIAGVYGTNFEYLPEKDWHWGYLYFWCFCILITIVFVFGLWRAGMLRVK